MLKAADASSGVFSIGISPRSIFMNLSVLDHSQNGWSIDLLAKRWRTWRSLIRQCIVKPGANPTFL